MRCYDCGEMYIEVSGSLSLKDNFIGDYTVPGVQYFQCTHCGKLLFPKNTILKKESLEKDIQTKLISNLPVSEFVFANDAAELLGISKQAFNKNHRIKNGYIYSVTIGNKKLFNKKSIQLFKENGDGRFNLSSQTEKEPPDSVVIIKASSANKNRYQIIQTSYFQNKLYQQSGHCLYQGSVQ